MTMNPLGSELRRAVRASRLTWAAVATKAGLDRDAIALFMRGGELSLTEAERLAAALGLVAMLVKESPDDSRDLTLSELALLANA